MRVRTTPLSAADDPAAELRQRFAIESIEWRHGDFAPSLLLPGDPESLIDDSPANTDERMPYWAELWPSARALARWVLDQADADLTSAEWIELGCGLALPSLALRARDRTVLATDYDPDALAFAAANAARNGFGPMPTELLDWRIPEPHLHRRFGAVIAADVLYEQRNVEPLSRAFVHLIASGGRAIVADPERAYLAPFLERMRALGWRAEQVGESAEPASLGAPEPRMRVVLWEISPRR